MIAFYDLATGEVLHTTGTNSLFPEGPENLDNLWEYLKTKGISQSNTGIRRYHDENEAHTVDALLRHKARVDVRTGKVVHVGEQPVPFVDPSETKRHEAKTRLGDLKAKGVNRLTPQEKDELLQHLLELS